MISCRPFHGLADVNHVDLGLTPQALCFRPLRRLMNEIEPDTKSSL